MPNGHGDWRPGSSDGRGDYQAVLDLAAVHGLWAAVQGWKDHADPDRRGAYLRIEGVHEGLIRRVAGAG